MTQIHKLYSNVIEPKHATKHSACFDIHAHLRGPCPSEDKFPDMRIIRIIDRANNLTETEPSLVWYSDIPSVSITIPAFGRALIPTGIIFDLEEHFSVRIHPRSGLAWKYGVTLINCEGVIDSDYCKEVFIPLFNASEIPFTIKHGDRVAQFEVLQHYKSVDYLMATEASAVEQKTNRVGGFGSTGV